MWIVLLLTFSAGPIAPPYREVPIALPYVEQHSGQPITVPKAVAHNYRGWGSCGCTMCLGLHMANMHRLTTKQLDAIGYRNWSTYHTRLHDAMGTAKPSACEGGSCQQTGPVRRLLGGWR